MSPSVTAGLPAPTLAVVDGISTTTSLDVARHFGKRHNDVLRAIRSLIEQLDQDHARNFAQMVFETDIGSGATRQDPAYRITRDGFTLLAMGFTGKRALQWKLAYLDAFNRMEAQLAEQAHALPGIDPRARLAAQRASREDLLRATIILMMADDQGGVFMFDDTERPMPLFESVAALTGVVITDLIAETKATIKAQVAEEIKALKAQLAPAKAEKPSTPNDPAAPAGKGAGKGSKAKNTRPAAPAVVREDEARQGIAAAMQGVEGQPVDGPDGAQAGPQPAGELAIDVHVKVLPSATGPKQRPWIGKTGIVRGKIGSQAWDVCFTASVARPITKKAVAEFVGFDASELEVVES